MRFALSFLFAAAIASAPVSSAERTLSLTDFDRLRVDGSFVVEVRTGPATSGKVTGAQTAIDAASVAVQGRTLIIRRAPSNWGGYPGQVPPVATIRISVPLLASVWVSGPAKVSVERLKGLRVAASLEGPGALTIGNIAADRTDLAAVGAGTMTVSGTGGSLSVIARGAGTFDAGRLVVQDVKATIESAGATTLSAKRTADIAMSGTGSVTVLGKPACTVKNVGSGTVDCG